MMKKLLFGTLLTALAACSGVSVPETYTQSDAQAPI